MLDILSDNVITNHLKIMRQEQLNSLSYHRQVFRSFTVRKKLQNKVQREKWPVPSNGPPVDFLKFFNKLK